VRGTHILESILEWASENTKGNKQIRETHFLERALKGKSENTKGKQASE
jgi:hypothetical protein